MKGTTQKIRYFLYARKSSESDDRQVQSIDDQINRLKQYAKDLGLNIKKVYTESKSAKKPNNRPIFDEMIEGIEHGEADGILCWQINRLSRNPVDSGKLNWILQQGILKSIRTPEREYLPEDNALILSVESGVANQFILDLSKNTKRGMQSKLEKGWQTGIAPLGYLNDKENKIITSDPERFNLVRKMWDLMLTGNYTPPQILNIANNEWGFRTRKFKRMGDNPLSKSGIYKLFTNLFYTGIIQNKRTSIQYQGQHEAMITMEEYDRVQIILGKEGHPRPQRHQFAFTGAMRCGECGCFYTAEIKRKVSKKTGLIQTYTYYHCTRKTIKVQCSQKKVIRDDNLELQIEGEIEKYTILPEFLEWALEGLSRKNDREIDDRSKIYENQHQAITQAQKELDELTRMRCRQLIDDEAFIRESKPLKATIGQLKEKLRTTETRAENWLELTEKTFTFAAYARKAFITATGPRGLERKKEILLALGVTPIITNKILSIETNEWFIPIKNNYPALEREYLGLEPQKMPMNAKRKEALASLRTQWLRR